MTTAGDRAGDERTAHHGTLLWIVALGWLAFAILLAIAEQMGVPGRVLPALGLFAVVSLVAAAFTAAVFDDERSAAPPAANGWAISGTLAGSVSFLGTLGGLFAVGFDGLWVGLGLTSGVVLAAALVAPYIRRIGCRSIPQFMDSRYGGWVRGLTFAVIMSAAVLILAAVFSMLGQAAALLTGTVPVAGIAVAAALVLAVLLRGGAAAGLTLAVLGVVIVAGLITVSGALGWSHSRNPAEALAYGNVLAEISNLEIGLLGQKLADGASIKRHSTPFLTLDAVNFTGSVLTVMAGTAALPMMIDRSLGSADARGTRASLAWGLLLLLPFVILGPAVAAFVKLSVLKQLVGAAAVANLPSWMLDLGQAGFLKICGVAAIDPTAVAMACKSLGGHKGVVRLQDFALEPEAVWLAVSRLSGLPLVISALAAATVFAAGVAGLIAAAQAIGSAFGSRYPEGAAASISVVLAVVGAAVAAVLWPEEAKVLVMWPFALATAALFPALVLGVWSRRVNSWGAAAGMIAGLAVTLYYLCGTRYGAVGFAEMWSGFSNASPAAQRKLQLLRDAWLGAEGATKDAAWIALQSHARSIANWWGVKPSAAGLFGLPVSLVATLVISWMTPRPSGTAAAAVSALRGENETSTAV